MAEGAALEMLCMRKCTGGSTPSLSASLSRVKSPREKFGCFDGCGKWGDVVFLGRTGVRVLRQVHLRR